MAPRSAARLVSGRKKSKDVRRKKKASTPSFSCYRVVEEFSVYYFGTSTEAKDFIAASGMDGSPKKITVKSNEELAKLLRENTL